MRKEAANIIFCYFWVVIMTDQDWFLYTVINRHIFYSSPLLCLYISKDD